MAINNNLYPPIVDTYTPVFVIRDYEIAECKIPINFSSYNSINDIDTKAIQVIVSYQATNKNALNIDTYPSQIMLKTLNTDGTITIKGTDLQDGNFQINTYYKIQIRFTKIGTILPNSNALDTWLAENLESFSEWSTVILARGVSYSGINLIDFPTDTSLILNTTSVRVVGELRFENTQETDFLQSYKIIVEHKYDNDLKTDTVYQTETIFNEAGIYGSNEINYLLEYAFQAGETYTLHVDYITKLGYQNTSALYNFIIIPDYSTANTDLKIQTIADNEEGRVKVIISKDDISVFNGQKKIAIVRASSKQNFTIWEDILIGEIEEIKGEMLYYFWYDYTVESGVWYAYGLQEIIDDKNTRTIIQPLEKNYVMVDSEYAYLVADNKQLKIKFNAKISSMKNMFSESKTDTIGSKYPFIKRNGLMNYRTFPISGTISYFCDEENTLTSKEQIYGDHMQKYLQYNQDNFIGEYNDYIYEKAFRDVVMDFLHKNNVKLFKSTTEGNILVKLMDISFTPNETLNKYLYGFSCTAYEIDECSIDNYNKYNIQPIHSELSHSIAEENNTLQVFASYMGEIGANNEFINIVKQEQSLDLMEDKTISELYLSYLKIQIYSEPYLIKDNNGIPEIATNPDEPDIYLGYIVYINEKPFVISQDGIYILSGEELQITSLTFTKDTVADIQYTAEITLANVNIDIIEKITYYSKLGQLAGPFDYKESLYSTIWNSYYLDIPTEYQQVLASLNSLTLDAEPGAIFYMKPSTFNSDIRYIVGPTGVLNFYNDNYIIKEAYFAGKHFEIATLEEAEREQLPETKYLESGITLDEIYDVANLKTNYVYIINNQRYIWHNQQMFQIDQNNDIQCPVEGLVDYTCEIMKGYYA